MTLDNAAIRELANQARSRTDVWAQLLNEQDARSVAEIGVYRGEFAAELLRKCPRIETYYMVILGGTWMIGTNLRIRVIISFTSFLKKRSGVRSLQPVNG